MARGDRTQERWSVAFDSTVDTDKSPAATTIDAAGVDANPLLKRDVLRGGWDPDVRDNGNDKDEEEDITCNVVLARCSRVCLAQRGQVSER